MANKASKSLWLVAGLGFSIAGTLELVHGRELGLIQMGTGVLCVLIAFGVTLRRRAGPGA